jgi:chemotaxis protein histidine kinase CheA
MSENPPKSLDSHAEAMHQIVPEDFELEKSILEHQAAALNLHTNEMHEATAKEEADEVKKQQIKENLALHAEAVHQIAKEENQIEDPQPLNKHLESQEVVSKEIAAESQEGVGTEAEAKPSAKEKEAVKSAPEAKHDKKSKKAPKKKWEDQSGKEKTMTIGKGAAATVLGGVAAVGAGAGVVVGVNALGYLTGFGSFAVQAAPYAGIIAAAGAGLLTAMRFGFTDFLTISLLKELIIDGGWKSIGNDMFGWIKGGDKKIWDAPGGAAGGGKKPAAKKADSHGGGHAAPAGGGGAAHH